MEANQSYGKRMWAIWGPFVIKLGISMFVYFVGAAALMARYIVIEGAKSGLDAFEELMADQQKYEQMVTTVTGWMLDFAVPIEGIAAFLTIPVMLFFMYRDRSREKQRGVALVQKKAPVWKYPAVVLISAAMCLALNNLMLLGNLSSYSDSYEETMEAFYQLPFAVQILCLGILMPACEELVFRGLMYRRLRSQAFFLHAALYTAVVFGLTHGNLVQCVYGFAMGMLFAYVYEKYGSVMAPVTAHVTANLLALAGTNYNWFSWMLEDVARIGVVTVICAAAASTIYVLMQRMESVFPEVKTRPGGNGQDGNEII